MKYTYIIKNKSQILGEKEICIDNIDDLSLISIDSYTREYTSKLKMRLNKEIKIEEITFEICDYNSKEYVIQDLNKIKACDEFFQEDFFFLFLPKIFKKNQRFFKLLNVETKRINLATVEKIDDTTFYLLTSNSVLYYYDNCLLKYFENLRTGVILESIML